MARISRTGVIPPKLSRRQAGKYFIDAVLRALQMRPSQLSTLTGHAASTVARYRAGKRVPTMGFILDLIDEAPNAGFTVDQVAPRLGHSWKNTRDPHRHRTFADYIVTIRVLEGLSRNQFAIRLGLTIGCVRDLERGVLPDDAIIRKLVCTFLKPEYSNKDIVTVQVPGRAASVQFRSLLAAGASSQSARFARCPSIAVKGKAILRFLPACKDTGRTLAGRGRGDLNSYKTSLPPFLSCGRMHVPEKFERSFSNSIIFLKTILKERRWRTQ